MLDEIARFKKVADLGSFTKAARSLKITQPALTQSIHRLEEELGYKLFKLVGHKIYLTYQGEIVLEILEKILGWWEKIKNLKDASNFPISYSIGLFDNAALQLSPYIQEKSKNLKIEVTIDRSANLLRKLQYGLVDICICVVPKDPSLFANAFLLQTYREKLVPVSATVWTKSLSKLPFILYNKDSQTQRYVDETFIKAGIKPNIVVESINPLFMRDLAMKNFGVALLPLNMVKEDIREKRLFMQKISISFQRTCGIFLGNKDSSRDLTKLTKDIIQNLGIRLF